MEDPDTELFPYLIEGVPLGINENIAPSKCFPLQPPSTEFDPPLLSVHHTNWSSAEDDPETVRELIPGGSNNFQVILKMPNNFLAMV